MFNQKFHMLFRAAVQKKPVRALKEKLEELLWWYREYKEESESMAFLAHRIKAEK